MRSESSRVIAVILMLAWCMMRISANADEARHSAAVSVVADADDSRLWQARLGLPLSERAWMQASLGRTEVAAADGDTQALAAALGVDGQHAGAAVEFTRRSSDAMEIVDWQGSIAWRPARSELGVHALLRDAEYETTSTMQTTGLFGPTTTDDVVGLETAKGKGFGMHGRFDVTPQMRIFGGWRRYRYDFTRASAAGGETFLQGLLGATAASGVTREQALIERTWHVGASYLLDRHTFAVQYLHDRIALSGETLRTLQAQAELAVGQRWRLVPVLGRSSGDAAVEFGGLSAMFKW